MNKYINSKEEKKEMMEKKQIPRDQRGHVLESIKKDRPYWENLLKEYHTLAGIARVY